ncbi:MAG: ribonuclease H-like domain-containing protein [Emergencia sp.]
MKTYIDTLKIPPYQSRIFDHYFGDKPFAVFDIETTGLSPASCKVILSGILLCKGDECQIVQYFANEAHDEKEIIEKTMEILSQADYIMTYNGKHFDIPFMETRGKRHGLSFRSPYNLDLYLVLSGHSQLRKVLPNLKQKSVEMFMGLSSGREDEISGKESVELYHRYMTTKAFALEKTILLHNHDDLIQLRRLLPIISKTDFHKAMYKLGFPAGPFLVQKINMAGRDLCVSGIQTSHPIDYISFPTEEKPYSLQMDSASSEFSLQIPGSAAAGSIYFDAQAILKDGIKEIEKYPSVVNGYLIISENGSVNYMEINHFLKKFLVSLSF